MFDRKYAEAYKVMKPDTFVDEGRRLQADYEKKKNKFMIFPVFAWVFMAILNLLTGSDTLITLLLVGSFTGYILDIFNKVFGGILLSISFFLLLFYFPGGILLIVMNGILFICSVVTVYYTLHLNSLNFYIEAARKVSIQKHMEELED